MILVAIDQENTNCFQGRFVHPLRIVPFGTTEPYSPLREAVYAQGGTELIEPADDPDGWELITSSVKGRLFDQEDVEIYLRVSATYLPYTHFPTLIPRAQIAFASDTFIIPSERLYTLHPGVRKLK